MKNRDYTRFSKEEIAKKEEPAVCVEEIDCKSVMGYVDNCVRLNVRCNPSIDADVIAEIDSGTKLMIDENESTEDFYKVCTESGIEGFCMKQFVTIES